MIIKNKMKDLFIKDYMIDSTKKILKLRNKILLSKNKFFKAFKIRKYNKLLSKMNSFFPISNDISNDICFPHGISGIFISNGAKVGNNCTIFQQVTIGSNSLEDSKNKGFPIIGHDVYIGAGAKIIGNVIVGNNVRIGANAVVVKNIPDNTTVVGTPIKIITHEAKLNNNFIYYKR